MKGQKRYPGGPLEGEVREHLPPVPSPEVGPDPGKIGRLVFSGPGLHRPPPPSIPLAGLAFRLPRFQISLHAGKDHADDEKGRSSDHQQEHGHHHGLDPVPPFSFILPGDDESAPEHGDEEDDSKKMK